MKRRPLVWFTQTLLTGLFKVRFNSSSDQFVSVKLTAINGTESIQLPGRRYKIWNQRT